MVWGLGYQHFFITKCSRNVIFLWFNCKHCFPSASGTKYYCSVWLGVGRCGSVWPGVGGCGSVWVGVARCSFYHGPFQCVGSAPNPSACGSDEVWKMWLKKWNCRRKPWISNLFCLIIFICYIAWQCRCRSSSITSNPLVTLIMPRVILAFFLNKYWDIQKCDQKLIANPRVRGCTRPIVNWTPSNADPRLATPSQKLVVARRGSAWVCLVRHFWTFKRHLVSKYILAEHYRRRRQYFYRKRCNSPFGIVFFTAFWARVTFLNVAVWIRSRHIWICDHSPEALSPTTFLINSELYGVGVISTFWLRNYSPVWYIYNSIVTIACLLYRAQNITTRCGSTWLGVGRCGSAWVGVARCSIYHRPYLLVYSCLW